MKKIMMGFFLFTVILVKAEDNKINTNKTESKKCNSNSKKDICVNTEEKSYFDVFCPDGTIGSSMIMTITTRHCIGKPDHVQNIDFWFDDDPCN